MSILAAVLADEDLEGVLFREHTTLERGWFRTAGGVVTITESHLHFDPDVGSGGFVLFGANILVSMAFNAVTLGWAARRTMYRRPSFFVKAPLASVGRVQIRRRRVRVWIDGSEQRFVLSRRKEFQLILEKQRVVASAHGC
jgi:hypothetical protein